MNRSKVIKPEPIDLSAYFYFFIQFIKIQRQYNKENNLLI